jgi:hypothetical protein
MRSTDFALYLIRDDEEFICGEKPGLFYPSLRSFILIFIDIVERYQASRMTAYNTHFRSNLPFELEHGLLPLLPRGQAPAFEIWYSASLAMTGFR